MSEPLRMLIAANHPAAVSGLMRKVKLALGRDVEAETLTTLTAVKVRLRAGDRPPVVVIDCALHGFESRETLGGLQLEHPAVRLVALVQRATPHDEAELVRVGARAVLSWDACPRLTGRVLEIVASGSSYMSTAALLAITGDSRGAAVATRLGQPLPAARPSALLTEHEARILAHIRRGESNRVIGAALGLDENRIKIHLRAIFRKTGARNRTEAALRAPLAGMAAAAAAAAATATATGVLHGVPMIAPASELAAGSPVRAIA